MNHIDNLYKDIINNIYKIIISHNRYIIICEDKINMEYNLIKEIELKLNDAKKTIKIYIKFEINNLLEYDLISIKSISYPFEEDLSGNIYNEKEIFNIYDIVSYIEGVILDNPPIKIND